MNLLNQTLFSAIASKPMALPPKPSPSSNASGLAAFVASVRRSRFGILAMLIIMTSVCTPAHAVIPEPDNVIYGVIAIGNSLVTSARTNVFVEVQRPTGEILSRYRMGHDTAYGNFYVVPVGLESVNDPVNSAASVPGAPVRLLVKELVLVPRRTEVTRFETNIVLLARGTVQRMDFGNPHASAAVGYADWETANGLPEDSERVDTDGDGVVNQDEYLAGTDPRDPSSKFSLAITRVPTGVEVSFPALSVRGWGYAPNTSRIYTLEGSTNLVDSAFASVPGQASVLGNDRLYRRVFPFDGTNPPPAFYRAKIRLSPAR